MDSVTPSGQAWAVGWELSEGAKRSLVLHFDGARWTRTEHPVATVDSPWSVHMISDDSGWITAGRRGFLRWDGQAWREVSYPAGVDAPITAVDGTSEDNVWAVGGVYSGGPAFLDPLQIILYYDGAAWVAHSITRDDLLTDISVQSDREAWSVGQYNRVFRFDGVRWRELTDVPNYPAILEAVAAVGPGDAWFAGAQCGYVMHRQDDELSVWGGYRPLDSPRGLTSISVLPDGSGWAVGTSGPVVSRRAETWEELDNVPRASELEAVLAIGDKDVWAGGAPGSVARYDGRTWDERPLPTNLPLRDFSALGPDDVWAVASDGDVQGGRATSEILHFDGAGWQVVHTAAGVSLLAIDMIDPADGWVAGTEVLRYDGASWAAVPFPSHLAPYGIRDIAFASRDSGWAVANESVLQYRGGEWWPLELDGRPGPYSYYTAVDTAPNGDLWLASDLGYRVFNGGTWTEWTPTAASISAINIAGDDLRYSVWMSGQYDTVVRVDVDALAPSTPSPAAPRGRVFLPLLVSPK